MLYRINSIRNILYVVDFSRPFILAIAQSCESDRYQGYTYSPTFVNGVVIGTFHYVMKRRVSDFFDADTK
ncbi:hypothetical protein [Fischerella major]|uniref:hypothetical protein n=1 Tax=Fischerella major TaxID=210993 RepID=UPI001C49D1D6|nr:hypothetical protein [Fischerella major]